MDTQDYSKAYNKAFRHLIKLEGGYVNDPDDAGGETNFGISKRSHPTVDIANLTLDQAKVIYHEHYWLANHCDDFCDPVAMALFDGVVNHRASTARKILQQALHVKPDGIFGPLTIAAAKDHQSKETLVRYFTYRATLYHDIVAANSSQAKFLRGWFARLFKLQQFIMEESWPWLP
jgi:lysozyme family protein